MENSSFNSLISNVLQNIWYWKLILIPVKSLHYVWTRFVNHAKKHIVLLVPVLPATENAKEIWEAIKPEVQATIEEHLDQEEIVDEDDGPVEFQGDVDTALEW